MSQCLDVSAYEAIASISRLAMAIVVNASIVFIGRTQIACSFVGRCAVSSGASLSRCYCSRALGGGVECKDSSNVIARARCYAKRRNDMTVQTSITLRRNCGDTRQRSPSQSSDTVRSLTRMTVPARSRRCLSVKPALSLISAQRALPVPVVAVARWGPRHPAPLRHKAPATARGLHRPEP